MAPTPPGAIRTAQWGLQCPAYGPGDTPRPPGAGFPSRRSRVRPPSSALRKARKSWPFSLWGSGWRGGQLSRATVLRSWRSGWLDYIEPCSGEVIQPMLVLARLDRAILDLDVVVRALPLHLQIISRWWATAGCRRPPRALASRRPANAVAAQR